MNSKGIQRKQAWLVLCVLMLGTSEAAWPGNDVAAAVQSKENTGGARLHAEQTVVDLGVRLWYTPISHVFLLVNEGSEALTLRVEKKSCGCTTELLSGDVIAPGGSGQVTIGFTPKPDRPRLGRQNFTVEFATNDPLHARVVFSVKVELVEQVRAVPATVDFGEVSSKTPCTKPLEIICHTDETMPKVLSVEASSEWLTVRALDGDSGAAEYRHRYEITLDPSQIAGGYRAHLLVTTDSASVPALEIPATALVPLPLQAAPRKILFGIVRSDTQVTKSVVLSAAEGGAVPLRPTCADGRIAATLEPVPEGTGWTLSARLTAGAVAGAAEKLKTSVDVFDANGVKVAEVPVFAVIAPGSTPQTDETGAGRP